jgi:23S rRNA (uracil1939-C5)-methyltransferase
VKSLNCSFFPSCNACTEWNTPYIQQEIDKITNLRKLLNASGIDYFQEINFFSSGPQGQRHKADFGCEYDENQRKYKFGYFDKSGHIFHINNCLQYTPELQNLFSIFLELGLPENLKIKKSSIRLRVGPNHLKGVWFDMANTDIKNILDEKFYLESLIAEGFIIEIGQKKKIVKRTNNILKLKEPELHPWFKTWDHLDQAHPMQGHISSFTQPSWHSGKLLIDELRNRLKQTESERILEFGAGIGFFSKLLSKSCKKLTILEIDPTSLEALKCNLADEQQKVEIRIGNYHQEKIEGHFDLVFVNPARSGLKNFSENLLQLLPDRIIYISCFPESMMIDLKRLKSEYSVCNISIVDQFPQTKHYEIFCELRKN